MALDQGALAPAATNEKNVKFYARKVATFTVLFQLARLAATTAGGQVIAWSPSDL